MRDLQGRTAVVTGGAGGIGLALAKRCAAAGMNIMIADVDSTALAAALDTVSAFGTDVASTVVDVADPAAVQTLADHTFDRFGEVHLLCNNAGVGPGGVMWEIPLAQWRWVLDVGLWGIIHGVRSFVPRMLLQEGHGHILNTASVAGLFGSPGMGAYAATKHAVVGMSQSLQHDLELAGGTIGVTVLCPGMTRTRMNESGRLWPTERLGAKPAAGLEPSHPATRGAFYRLMEESGVEPSYVADTAIAAVQRGDFWALPDRSVVNRLEQRVKTMSRTKPRLTKSPRMNKEQF